VQNSKKNLQKDDNLGSVTQKNPPTPCLLHILKMIHAIHSFETCRSFDILCSFQNSTDNRIQHKVIRIVIFGGKDYRFFKELITECVL
jgi:hypothetical protein